MGKADIELDVRAKRPDLDDQNWQSMLMDLQLKDKRIKDLEERQNTLENSFETLQNLFQEVQRQMTIHLTQKYRGGSTS